MPEAKMGGASLLHNVRANFLTFLVGKAAAGIAGIVLLRVLKPELSGQYAAALSWSWLFTLLGDLGLGAYLTREVSRDRPATGRLLAKGLLLQALQLSLAAIALAVFLGLGGAGGLSWRLVALAFGVQALASLAAPFASCLHGWERFALAGLLASGASLLNAGGLVVALWLSPSPQGALQATLWTNLASAVLWYLAAKQAGLTPVFDRTLWQGLANFWRRSLPFAMVSATNQLYVRVDMVLLTWLASTTMVGYYHSAVKTVDLLVPVLGALSGPMYARLAFLGAAGNAAQAQASLNRGLRWMVALCLPLGLGGSLLAEPLMVWLYGPEFAPSAAGFVFLAWVPALIGMHGVLLHALNALGLTTALAGVFGANLVLNIGLNLWLIPHYGFAAAAAVSALCEAVNLTAAITLLRRHGLRFNAFSVLWPSLPSAVLMGLCLAWLSSHPPQLLAPLLSTALGVPVSIFAGAFGYLLIMLALGYFGAEERDQLRRLTGKAD